MNIQDKINKLQAEMEAVVAQYQAEQANNELDIYWEKQQEKIRQYVVNHQNEWKQVGNTYKKWREDHYLSKAQVARQMGIASSTLSKFEDGKAVRSARAIQAAYDMVQTLYSKQIEGLWGIKRYIANIQTDFESVLGKLQGENQYETFADSLWDLNSGLMHLISEARRKYIPKYPKFTINIEEILDPNSGYKRKFILPETVVEGGKN